MNLLKSPDKNIQIYRGKLFKSISADNIHNHLTPISKVIVFDLDETIGSFGDLYILWMAILSEKEVPHLFDEFVDIYPEFFRYGIFPILDFLQHKKNLGECSKICIYTNNQCQHLKWVHMICDYLNTKMNKDNPKIHLFDRIICAFKINNKIVELDRTTHDKTIGDFIKCTLLPKKTEICFIDDTLYENMLNDRVYYIKPKMYQHNLSTDEIIERFMDSEIIKKMGLNRSIESKLYDFFVSNNAYHKSKYITQTKIDTDIMVSQKIMYHLKDFFLLSSRKNPLKKTRKIKLNIGRFTRKKHLRDDKIDVHKENK